MLYGSSPGFGKTGLELGLKPAMRLTAPVIALRTVPAGDGVGYGGRWQAKRNSRVATLAMGYGDGYPRHAPDNTPVWLCGRRVPLVGKVSMDMLTVDVTDIPDVFLGDTAELWGKHLSVDEVALSIGTIGYELLTRVSPRVDRVWLKGEQ
jgi:alanine racemase